MSTRTRRPARKYGLGHFLLDLFLICITGGLWGVWMIFKFIRS